MTLGLFQAISPRRHCIALVLLPSLGLNVPHRKN